ncbi:hypothetical protein CFIMG_008552RA00001 [Ceratocystis fimbriata CBS 114723]|uniref:Secreted protein n=1 Tax=Ceratocystis fimbriata CBS 114723 TaxID=1035309 RepID=A0A2C5WR91_9PEZI|nr:hypothetical protein CFIMG_008552RA00001 [Ceratocystis fimbriata CBS 114723]
MQLIHAIIAVVAASEAATAAPMSGGPHLAPSSLAKPAGMKYARTTEDCRAVCGSGVAEGVDCSKCPFEKQSRRHKRDQNQVKRSKENDSDDESDDED